jgi:fused signal recognition particle receptor
MKQNNAEQTGFLARLKTGLSKSAAGLTGFFTKKKLDAATVAELEESLIKSDMGSTEAKAIAQGVAKNRYDAEIEPGQLRALVADEIAGRLAGIEKPLAIDGARKPFVILVAGVNGTGKTTTIGKLAKRFVREGRTVMLAAGDTFRAAAIEQLGIWAGRAKAEFIATKPGGDAAGLAFGALEKARAQNTDILIIDTAGRLQNKSDLMAELEKIARVIKKLDPSAPHAVLLVLDATTGQNGLRQARVFGEVVDVTGIVLTKLDGTAKGGIVIAVQRELGVPVKLVGLGEGPDDLAPFDPAAFVDAILG